MLFEYRTGVKPEAAETATHHQAKVRVKAPGGWVGLHTNDAVAVALQTEVRNN
jgi:hypothetical protein